MKRPNIGITIILLLIICDDAFISFRYIKNLEEERRLVYFMTGINSQRFLTQG